MLFLPRLPNATPQIKALDLRRLQNAMLQTCNMVSQLWLFKSRGDDTIAPLTLSKLDGLAIDNPTLIRVTMNIYIYWPLHCPSFSCFSIMY